MGNEDFLNYCYENILGRSPGEKEKYNWLKEIEKKRISREKLVDLFLKSSEFLTIRRNKEFVAPGHYYSAVPSLEERMNYIRREQKLVKEIPGIDLSLGDQKDLLQKFVMYHNECPFPDDKSADFRYFFRNPSYSYSDGLVLYSMIRHFKPKRIIEIGSGYSSCCMLDTSDNHFKGKIDLTFIEPYPDLVNSLIRKGDKKHKIMASKIQEVSVSVFEELEQNDICFVDSTHVSKLDSDVNHIFFEILPSLKKGVLIHFHDIFWPFDYPKDWIQGGKAWNEAYMLRTFLQFNQSFKVELFTRCMHEFEGEFIKANLPRYMLNKGGNIWLRKIN